VTPIIDLTLAMFEDVKNEKRIGQGGSVCLPWNLFFLGTGN
jgi:hypothetical protein